MIIKNGLVYGPDHQFAARDIVIEGDRIVSSTGKHEVLDAEGNYVIPGLIDIHIHGCCGFDFGDASTRSLHKILKYEARHGITAICPTSMTMPKESIKSSASILNLFQEGDDEAASLGMNMEGPFISPEKKGSQEVKNILNPDASFVLELQKVSGGNVTLVDFAPERIGAEQFIRELKDQVILSIAHTNADYETARRASLEGVHHVTHLYNAMSPYNHRAPGVVGAAADDPECMVELIADGFHNHPNVVRNTFRMFGVERIILISDSMRATGCPDGVYELGGHDVYVKENRALLKDGSIAASVTNVMDCMRNCVLNMGIRLEDAIQCSTENPARSVHAFSQRGSLEEGKLADIVVLDRKTLIPIHVILRGRLLY